MPLQTRICEILEIEYPIFLAGMGGASVPALAAAVSNAGGLGVLGAAACSVGCSCSVGSSSAVTAGFALAVASAAAAAFSSFALAFASAAAAWKPSMSREDE